jgi:hypothetical protein
LLCWGLLWNYSFFIDDDSSDKELSDGFGPMPTSPPLMINTTDKAKTSSPTPSPTPDPTPASTPDNIRFDQLIALYNSGVYLKKRCGTDC